MKSIGRYEILSEIGRGGMGVVYLARQHGLNRLVALKELHSIHASTPDIVSRFVRESRLVGSLNHPNIVIVHDYVEQDGAAYIAMEYMPRGSLRPWVGRMSLAQFAGVLEGLLAGLMAVEPKSIVHRDLKPENIMVAADGRVKIADFGIAKATQTANGVSLMTATGSPIGTPAYMAPERALEQEIGPWTDLYSVGVMAYEQFAGHLPFHDGLTPMAILLRHVNELIPPLLNSRPDLDPALSAWVARLLAKDSTKRTQSAAQAWEELEGIIIELLGARWRRAAPLPELGVPLGQSTPPTPEIESGFLSYGLTPTGVASSASAVPAKAGFAESPQSDGKARIPPAPSEQAARARTPPLRSGVLRVGVLCGVLAALAGFALAPAGTGPARAHTPDPSANTQRREPNHAYAATLRSVMLELNNKRAQAGAQLAHATDVRAQAAAAQQLAQAHEQAAAAIRSDHPQPAAQTANRAIAVALEKLGSAYAAMASAASREDRHGFDSARGATNRATGVLNQALGQLRQLGYPLSG